MSDSLTRAKKHLLLRLRLARACEIRNNNKERDKLLVLAGVNARRLGWNPIAAYCRKKVLVHNQGHLLNKYRSFAEAIECDDFQQFHKRLSREYGIERVEQLLHEANVAEPSREELTDDFEYAAALLGTSRDELESAQRDPAAPQMPEYEPLEHRTKWPYVIAILLGLAAVAVWLGWWWLNQEPPSQP